MSDVSQLDVAQGDTHVLCHQRYMKAQCLGQGTWCGLLFSINVSPFEKLLTKVGGRLFAKQIIENMDLKGCLVYPFLHGGDSDSCVISGSSSKEMATALAVGSIPAFHYALFSNVFPKTSSHLQKFKQESASLKLFV